MTEVWVRFAIAGAVFSLAACNPIANLKESDAQIKLFHQAYSGGNVDVLYAETGPIFHKATTRKQFQDMFDVMNARLGQVQSSKRKGFNVNSTGAGTVTTVAMDTQFAQGEGVETFTFLGNGDDMKLEGWHVDSNRLTITPADLAHEPQRSRSPPPVLVVAPASDKSSHGAAVR